MLNTENPLAVEAREFWPLDGDGIRCGLLVLIEHA